MEKARRQLALAKQGFRAPSPCTGSLVPTAHPHISAASYNEAARPTGQAARSAGASAAGALQIAIDMPILLAAQQQLRGGKFVHRLERAAASG